VGGGLIPPLLRTEESKMNKKKRVASLVLLALGRRVDRLAEQYERDGDIPSSQSADRLAFRIYKAQEEEEGLDNEISVGNVTDLLTELQDLNLEEQNLLDEALEGEVAEEEAEGEEPMVEAEEGEVEGEEPVEDEFMGEAGPMEDEETHPMLARNRRVVQQKRATTVVKPTPKAAPEKIRKAYRIRQIH